MYFQRVRHINSHMRNFLRFSLVAVLCCSLVMMGTLFWVDNSWALIFDDDPQTMVEISALLDDDLVDDSNLQDDDDGVIPITGGTLVRGNGDQDDNKDETFSLARQFGRVIDFKAHPALNRFEEQYTTRSYKDFGHLKVMPAGDGISQNNPMNLVLFIKGLPCITGGLFIFNN